jgi:GMP synthase-like glutamine amidotransferase
MKELRIHYFQHVAYEGPGSIEEWVSKSGHLLTSTKFFENQSLPQISDIDWLIIMGGSMSVHDEERFHWLITEKQFIRQAIEAGKKVLGICLGSQLISDVLGARVFKNREKEIGWFDIDFSSSSKSGTLFSGFGDRQNVFHWHGDTFDLPEKAVLIASSAACRNQAYVLNRKVLALQFHLETTERSLQQMIENGRGELSSGKYIQTEKEIIKNIQLIESGRKILFTVLGRMAELE